MNSKANKPAEHSIYERGLEVLGISLTNQYRIVNVEKKEKGSSDGAIFTIP